MPRKPFDKQASWQISAHGRNFMFSDYRRDIKSVSNWKERYFVGRYIGVLRLNGYQPLIRNGRKP